MCWWLETSLSLAACTCFSKVHSVRQFLFIDSAVGTRTAVDNALKIWQVTHYQGMTTHPLLPKKNKLFLWVFSNSRIKETRSEKPVLATKWSNIAVCKIQCQLKISVAFFQAKLFITKVKSKDVMEITISGRGKSIEWDYLSQPRGIWKSAMGHCLLLHAKPCVPEESSSCFVISTEVHYLLPRNFL